MTIQPKEIDNAVEFRNKNNGKEPENWDDVSIFFEDIGFSSVSIDNKYGAIDKRGNVIMPFQYDEADLFSSEDNLLAVKKGKYWGLVNSENSIIIPFLYDQISAYESHEYKSNYLNNTVIAVKNGKYGLLSKENELLIPFEYEYLTGNNWGYVGAKKSDKFGIIDLQNNVIIDFKYEFATCVDDKIFNVAKVIEEDSDNYKYEIATFDMWYKQGKVIKFGVIDINENTLYPFEDLHTLNVFRNNKLITYDYHLGKSFMYDTITKEKIYEPELNSLKNYYTLETIIEAFGM